MKREINPPRAPVERMRAKPIVTIALAAALGGGLLLAFPSLWMFLVLALLALLAAQAALFARSVRAVHRDSRIGIGLAPRASLTLKDPPARRPLKNPAAVLNRDLFTRARRHLEAVEQAAGGAARAAEKPRPGSQGKPDAPPPGKSGPSRILKPAAPVLTPAEGSDAAPPQHLAVDDVADHVAISAPGVRKARPASPPRPVGGSASPPAPPAVAKGEEDVDWFDDLRPPPPGTAEATPLRRPAGAAPAGEDEAETLLRMAEEALRRGDVTGARAGLGHYFSLLQATGRASPWQALRTQARVAVLEGNATGALQAFEALLKAGFEPTDEAVPPLIETLLAGVPREAGDPLRVSLLLKLLAHYRQKQDRPAMDRLYGQIVTAQERAGDDHKAVQYLKNHLEIRRVMGQIEGQIELVDRIGNKLFKLGDTAAAREFYELGMKLRGEREPPEAKESGGGSAP
jgi:tetratricopeptide (TPR) repeat protein